MSNEIGKSLIIKGLVPGLTERGKIKIGEKGRMITSAQGKQFQPPKKLDHFRVTTLLRGPDDNYQTDEEVHKLHGEKPRTLPVRLLYDQVELNFQCRYVCFAGKTMWCGGDGEAAWRLTGQNGKRQQVDCPCGRQLPEYEGKDRCKINGCLSVIIDGIDRVGGVWKFRTTSYNSVVGILSSLSLIKRITGGPLAGIQLNLTLNPKTVITPTDGKAMNVWVVGLEYKGSIQQLQQIGYKQALVDATHYERIAHIEEEARKLIAHDPIRMDDEDPADIVAEFYPEQFEAQAKDTRAATSGTIFTGETIQPEKTKDTQHGTGSIPSAEYEQQEGPPAGKEASQPQPDQETPAGSPKASDGLNGVEPQEGPGGGRRSRRNKFQVDPGLFNGVTEIVTCGCTPAQLLNLKSAAKSPECREQIKKAMAGIGYQELSYLRADEAEKLLTDLHLERIAGDHQHGASAESAEPPPDDVIDQVPSQENDKPRLYDDLLQCPYDGEWRSKSAHCLTHCTVRQADGFCPFLGEDPPNAVDLLGIGGAA